MLSNPNDPEEDTKDRLKQLADAVAPYEIELNRRGTPFFGGMTVRSPNLIKHSKFGKIPNRNFTVGIRV